MVSQWQRGEEAASAPPSRLDEEEVWSNYLWTQRKSYNMVMEGETERREGGEDKACVTLELRRATYGCISRINNSMTLDVRLWLAWVHMEPRKRACIYTWRQTKGTANVKIESAIVEDMGKMRYKNEEKESQGRRAAVGWRVRAAPIWLSLLLP